MKKYLYSILICLCLSVVFVQAQGIMSFKEETHDFGTIEEGTLATFEFEFTNTGNQPIEIREVKASCGCTAPAWSKAAVMPGKKGIIKASYDSKGRPGDFLKSLSVQSNARKTMLVLYLKGYVNPSKQTVSKETAKLKTQAGDVKKYPTIQLDKYKHNFGQVERGQSVKHQFMIYNVGQADLLLTNLKSACNCVSINLSSFVISAGQSISLELTFNAEKVENLTEKFTIETNDPNNPFKIIELTAEVYEDFSKQLFKEKKKTTPFD